MMAGVNTSTTALDSFGAAAPARDTSVSVAGDGLRNFRRYLYWSQVGGSVGLLLFLSLAGPVPLPPDPLGIAALVGAVVVSVAVVRLTDRHISGTPDAAPVSDHEWRVWAFAGSIASLAVAAAWVASGDQALWAYAPALIASLLVASLAPRRRRIAVAVCIGIAAGVGTITGIIRTGELDAAFPLGGAGATAVVMFVTLATIWTWRVAMQLDQARRAEASLAVANERLRFASELHDIQGHHLQIIALKSELASRLVRPDPDAAAREVAAVQQLAADALHDTRAVVHGYRRTTLDAEIANAAAVLNSAGIDATFHLDPGLDSDELSEASRHLLGLVVREAITNVLRHSTATHADITLTSGDRLCLTVTNDGVSQAPTTDAGGRQDLADRLRAAGGALSWQHTGDRFDVRAELAPHPSHHPVSKVAP